MQSICPRPFFPIISSDLPRMRDTNHSIDIFECGSQEFVGQDACCVFEPEQTVIRKHRPYTEKVRMQNAFLSERRETRVCMDQVDMFPKDDRSQVREEREIVWQGGGGSDGQKGNIVYLERGEQPTDADTVWRMTVRDDNDFVAPTDEVGAEHVYVIFHPANIGIEEIRYHSTSRLDTRPA